MLDLKSTTFFSFTFLGLKSGKKLGRYLRTGAKGLVDISQSDFLIFPVSTVRYGRIFIFVFVFFTQVCNYVYVTYFISS